MQKSDRIYLSKFALDPETEYLDLDDFDYDCDEEIDQFEDEIGLDEQRGFCKKLKIAKKLWPHEK